MSDQPKRPEQIERAIKALDSAFIDCTLHAQDAFALVLYVKELESAASPVPVPASAPMGEPIHQWRTKDGDDFWQDVPAERFKTIGPSFRRILYTQPAATSDALTDEEIDDMWIMRGKLMPRLRDFARALLARNPVI